MRKHVKPAHRHASIPDPERGCDLPPEGRDVEWNAYWAGLELRKDIVAKDVSEEEAERPRASPSPKLAAKATKKTVSARRKPAATAPAAASAPAPAPAPSLMGREPPDDELERLTRPDPVV